MCCPFPAGTYMQRCSWLERCLLASQWLVSSPEGKAACRVRSCISATASRQWLWSFDGRTLPEGCTGHLQAARPLSSLAPCLQSACMGGAIFVSFIAVPVTELQLTLADCRLCSLSVLNSRVAAPVGCPAPQFSSPPRPFGQTSRRSWMHLPAPGRFLSSCRACRSLVHCSLRSCTVMCIQVHCFRLIVILFPCLQTSCTPQ